MSYPKHLFKHPGPYGRGARTYAVAGADSEVEETRLLGEGWSLTKEDGFGEKSADAPEPSILDGNAKDIEAALPDLPLEELEILKAAETAGKTRKGVLAAIDAAIDAKLGA